MKPNKQFIISYQNKNGVSCVKCINAENEKDAESKIDNLNFIISIQKC